MRAVGTAVKASGVVEGFDSGFSANAAQRDEAAPGHGLRARR
jgi:hypothetical protein